MNLLKDTVTVKLQDVPSKILWFSPCYGGYAYITVYRGTEKGEKLVHVDKNGKKLWERHYTDSVDEFGMFHEKQVIVNNPTSSNIEIINLEDHSIQQVPHQYSFPDTSTMFIYTFSETRYLAIVEQGSSENKLVVSYYHVDGEVKKITDWKVEEEIIGSTIAKFNNHSKVGWFLTKQEQLLKFHTFDLETNQEEGTHRTFTINNTIGKEVGLENLSLALINMWQLRPNTYMMVTNTNRLEANKPNSKGKFNNNYVVDVVAGTIREFKTDWPDKWNTLQIDTINLGAISIFHTLDFEKGEPLHTPVFFVHNEREEIVCQDTWQATSRIRWFLPGYSSSTIIESECPLSDPEEVRVTTTRLVTIKQIYLHFLLHLNEDFDDDLLKETVELLEGEN